MVETHVVVIGAGPAGLAVSACLNRSSVPHEVFEREPCIAPTWRRHYDRLHLHTSRGFSALPHRAMPRAYPRYPSKEQLVEYLEAYLRHESLNPRLGVEATRLRREGPGWIVETSEGDFRCRAVVVATGANGSPVVPSWPGLEGFEGPVLHSAEYRTGEPFRGQDVLVVGFGNSGGEIALDLAEHGAHPVVSIRSPVNVIPRDVLGIPVLAIAVLLSRLPPLAADLLVWPILKAYYPSYRRLGLRKAELGPFRQVVSTGRVPLLDTGTISALRRGRIRVAPEVDGFEEQVAVFSNDQRQRFDAIVLATGYTPSTPPGIAPPSGGPPARETWRTGLYFCGFYVAPTGMLREIALEARLIASDIVGCREGGRTPA